MDYWRKPEGAPHKHEVRVVSLSVYLSVCLSVGTFMTQKYIRIVLIYVYLQLLIALVWCTGLHTNVQQTCSDIQLEQTASYTVYRSLMNNNFI